MHISSSLDLAHLIPDGIYVITFLCRLKNIRTTERTGLSLVKCCSFLDCRRHIFHMFSSEMYILICSKAAEFCAEATGNIIAKEHIVKVVT